MNFQSVRSLIQHERAACSIQGHVTGTPRTYGDRTTEDIWRAAVCNGQWAGINNYILPIANPCFLTFSFRVHPKSVAYNGCVSPNGPDIDTMVIGALGGIVSGRTPDRPSLRLLSSATLCWGYAATKTIVHDDRDAGVDITITPGPPKSVEDIRRLAPSSRITIAVSRGRDRRLAAKEAVEKNNPQQLFYPAASPITMTVVFHSDTGTRNITSAEHIEALIDGIGAATVGARRLFDAPKGSYNETRYCFDDSCVFALLVMKSKLNDSSLDALVDISTD